MLKLQGGQTKWEKPDDQTNHNMKITLKLYGGLAEYLPKNSSKNQSSIEIKEGLSVEQTLNIYGVPLEERKIVMVNGIHIIPEERANKILSELDSLAVWPQSTG